MTHGRTIAALASATIALTLAPQVYDIATALDELVDRHDHHEIVRHVELESLEPLPEVVVDDVIDGVRILADSDEHRRFVRWGIDRFETAGLDLTNVEIRIDVGACDGAVGYHAEERGHHVVVLCAVNEWTLLHELGHVWADLHLDEDRRRQWVQRRGLESWHAGEWHERGTEHAAEVIAFALYDTAHVPSRIGAGSYEEVVEDAAWLLGIAPLHQ